MTQKHIQCIEDIFQTQLKLRGRHLKNYAIIWKCIFRDARNHESSP